MPATAFRRARDRSRLRSAHPASTSPTCCSRSAATPPIEGAAAAAGHRLRRGGHRGRAGRHRPPGRRSCRGHVRSTALGPRSSPATRAMAVTLPAKSVRRPGGCGDHCARHRLVRPARAGTDLQSIDKVLIHSGTGGVGQAAIAIARAAGAEIFATAGSEQRRQLLRDMGIEHVYDSRSLRVRRPDTP